MTGRTVRSAVVRGLFVGLCLCEPLTACSRSPSQAFRFAAEQGDAEAQNTVGNMYAVGKDVPQDDAEAVRWYRLAAEQGFADAQHNLGDMYAYGLGVPQDETEALRWYRLAADQGFAAAQFMLGGMYGTGRGVAQDDVAAHMWFTLASAQSSGAVLFVKERDAVAARLTAEQIAEAQRLAREWKPTVGP